MNRLVHTCPAETKELAEILHKELKIEENEELNEQPAEAISAAVLGEVSPPLILSPDGVIASACTKMLGQKMQAGKQDGLFILSYLESLQKSEISI